MNSP